MNILLKKFLPKFLFSTHLPTLGTSNPYVSLFPNQLHPIIKEMLSQSSSSSIEDLNKLIHLLIAAENHRMYKESEALIKKCILGLTSIDDIVNDIPENELALIEIDSLFAIQSAYPSYLNILEREKLKYFYENTYSHILPFRSLLKSYENTQNNNDLNFINKICEERIKRMLPYIKINLSEYISYLRLFHTQINVESINHQFKTLLKSPMFLEISQSEKLILFFICMNVGADFTFINQIGLEPELTIKEYDEPKETCIKLEILKYKNMDIPDLNGLNLLKWDYKNLIWLSEFSGQFPLLIEKIHSSIMSSHVPKGMSLSSIFTYINYTQLPLEKHSDISNWLLRESALEHEEDLCQILIEISEKKLEPLYNGFFTKVLEMSLGNFKWENQNKIYYFGRMCESKDENMEYLRRYILNTYASYGTARREIPTSSYFYKILEITDVEEFYKNL